MNYKTYTTEDFVLDQKFRNWILKPNTELNLFWEKFIDDNPGKLNDLKEAINIIQNLHDFKYTLSVEKVNYMWMKIEQKTNEKIEIAPSTNKVIPINSQSVLSKHTLKTISPIPHYLRYAAIIAFLIVAGISILLVHQRSKISPVAFQKNEWVIKKNPWGQKSTIFLSDGSEVVLNAGSTLRYFENFTDHDRILYLDGEAFFTVSKDSLRPFRVHSGELVTEALGTAFNVKAYPEEKTISVALESGKVKVTQLKKMETPVTLKPGHQMEYDQTNGESFVIPFDSREILSWKNGIIYFKNSSEQQVFSRLEKWYGVKFQIPKSPGDRKWSYTAEFTNKSLENVLQSIGFSMNFNFSINNKNVQINYQ